MSRFLKQTRPVARCGRDRPATDQLRRTVVEPLGREASVAISPRTYVGNVTHNRRTQHKEAHATDAIQPLVGFCGHHHDSRSHLRSRIRFDPRRLSRHWNVRRCDRALYISADLHHRFDTRISTVDLDVRQLGRQTPSVPLNRHEQRAFPGHSVDLRAPIERGES
jgi:hypothetical protein